MQHQGKSRIRVTGLVMVGALAAGLAATGPAGAASPAERDHVAPTLPAPGTDATGWGAGIQYRDGETPRLVMVAPTGGIVPVTDDVDGNFEVSYVSPDAATVVGTVFDPELDHVARVVIVNTHTGTSRDVELSQPPTSDTEFNYLAFASKGFYVQRVRGGLESHTSQIVFRNYNGKVLHTTAKRKDTSNTHGIEVSADGKRLMQFGARSIYLRSTATGKVVEKLPAPWNPKESDGCWVEGHFGAQARILCAYSGESYAVSFATGRRSEIGRTATSTNAFPVPGGTVLNDRYGDHGGWKFLPANGPAQELALTPTSSVSGSDGNNLFVTSERVDPYHRQLIRYNVKTGAKQTLAGSASTGGGYYLAAQFVSRWQQ